LVTDRGIPILTGGILLGIIGATSVIGRITGGYISDKVGRKKIMMTEFFIQIVTLIWFLFSSRDWMLFIFAISFGLSSGGWAGQIHAVPADYFGFRATGQILGAAAIFCGVGVAMGPYIGGYIFDTTFSYNAMVIMCIMATIAAIISTSLLRPVLKLYPFK
jgi:MFS family permease